MRVIYISKNAIKVTMWVTIALAVVLMGLSCFEMGRTLTTATGHASYPCVVIDAGHGGFDPGAVGADGTQEDDICLKIAKFLQKELEEKEFNVIMTRSSENALATTKSKDMALRLNMIKQSHAAAVVSIHLNAFPNAQYYGAQSFYYKGSEQSKLLAESVQSYVKTAISPQNKRTCVATTDLAILKASSSPTVLVECGFISNATERQKLKQEKHQRAMAEAICKGLLDYFNK